jgi:hypothetical protein
MGSSGTGRFSDYTSQKKGKKGAISNGNGSGGASGQNQCDQQIIATLEDVERSQVFKEDKSIIKQGASFEIRLVGRVTAIISNKTLGYLPTEYNYLAGCMKSGKKYLGVILSVIETPVVRIQVQIDAIQ